MARTLNNEVDVLNIASLDNDIKDSFTRAMITEDVNTTSAAARRYLEGEYFIHTDRYLYKALEDIEAGTTITPDVNAEVVTVSEELVKLFAQSPEGIFEILSNIENTSVASKKYVKGSQFIWTDKKLYEATADIASGSTFVVGTNIKLADNLTSQIQTLTNNDDAMLNVLGSKNLLPNNAVSKVVADITWTVNPENGEITANGTASDLSAIYLTVNNAMDMHLKKGRYIMTGTPSNGSSDTYYMYLASDLFPSSKLDIGEGVEFTIDSDMSDGRVGCIIKAGVTVSNLVFKPMIRPASIEDGTYVLYAMTNRELTLQSTVETETLNDSLFYSPATIKKCGSVVSLNLHGFKDLVNKTNNIINGIIPIGYRPASMVGCTTLGTVSTAEPYKIAIDVNGNLRIYPYNGITTQMNVEETLTYII